MSALTNMRKLMQIIRSSTEKSLLHGCAVNLTTPAFIVICPPVFTRTVDPCLAEFRLVRSSDISDVTYVGLVGKAVELAKQLDLGYTDCILSMAASCTNLVNALLEDGFSETARLPQSINMVDVGLTEIVLLTKSFNVPDRMPRSPDEVLEMMTKNGFADSPEKDVAFYELQSTPLPLFPQKRILDSGQEINIRNLRNNEDYILWRSFLESAERGEGYAINLYPTLEYFREVILRRGHCWVIEDTSSGEIIGYYALRPSAVTRTKAGTVCEGLMIISKKYQNRSIGKEISSFLTIGGMQVLGYGSIIGLYVSSNERSKRINEFYDSFPVGHIPRNGFMKRVGWSNWMLVHYEMESWNDSTNGEESEQQDQEPFTANKSKL